MRLVVRDAEALRSAANAFRRRVPTFDAGALHALAAADPTHDERLDPAYREAMIPFYASSLGHGGRIIRERAPRA